MSHAALDMHGIESLPSGRFRVRFIRKGRSVSEIVATIQDAVNLRDAIRSDLASGEVVPLEGISAAVWGRTWLRDFRSGNRGYKTERGRFDLHIAAAAWARKPLGAVQTPDIVEWLMKLQKTRVVQNGRTLKRTLSFQTRKHVRNLASALFSDAISLGLCKTNPTLGVKVRKTPDDHLVERIPEEWPLKPSEQRTIAEALADDPERLMIMFAVGTGLRQGEQWNLHIADVHVDAPEGPYVNVRFGSKGKPPKNGRPRKVPLFGLALEAMRLWLEYLPTYAPSNPDGLVFPTPREAPEQEEGRTRVRRRRSPAGWQDASRVEEGEGGARRAQGLVASPSSHRSDVAAVRMVGAALVARGGEQVPRPLVCEGHRALRALARVGARDHRGRESCRLARASIERWVGGIVGLVVAAVVGRRVDPSNTRCSRRFREPNPFPWLFHERIGHPRNPERSRWHARLDSNQRPAA